MATILFIDDRAVERNKIQKTAEHFIPDGADWTVNSIDPLAHIEDYPTHIVENDIAVLVVDEKLHEQASETTGIAVEYDGHDLVKYLRPRFPELPIFIVTAHAEEDDVQNAATDVEGIITRRDFTKSPQIHTARMIRSGQRFSTAMAHEMSLMASISEKIAIGTATEAEVEQLNAIREKLSLPYPEPAPVYAKDLIPKAEQLISDAQALLNKIGAAKKS